MGNGGGGGAQAVVPGYSRGGPAKDPALPQRVKGKPKHVPEVVPEV